MPCQRPPSRWSPLRLFLPALLCATLTACDIGTLPPGVTASEALTFRHVCADSFQIANRFLRSSSLTVRIAATWIRPGSRFPQGLSTLVAVPPAPGPDRAAILGFRLAIPTDLRVHLLATPTGAGPVPSLAATNDGPARCTPVPLVRLRTGVGFGLTGAITPQRDSVAPGTLVSWAFAPADGSGGVDVRINGVPAAASGSLTVDGETTISAVGTTRTAPSSELLPLIDAMRSAARSQSPDRVAAQVLDRLVALLGSVDDTTGDRLLQEFQTATLQTAEDVEGAIRLDSLLGNTLIPFDLPPGASLRTAPSAFAFRESTAWFVAAGILTPQQKLAASARILHTLIRDRSLLGPNDLFRAWVSPTMTGLGTDVRQCIARTIAPGSPRERINNFLSYCLVVYGSLLDGIDFVEAASQILRQWIGGVPARRTSLEFMDSLRSYRALGHHLIIDSHSQGTLIAREAIAELSSRNEYRFVRDSICIGVVAMAGPVSGNWVMPSWYVREFATEGDLVATMGGSQAPRIRTDLTRQRDSALAALPSSAPALRAAVSLIYALQLHDLQEVYLGEAPPRDHLMGSNRSIRAECEAGELRSTLPGGRISLYRGEEFPLGLYFQPFNQNGRPLNGRSTRLVAASPALVDLIENFSILTKQVGQATVTARSGRVEGAATIDIKAPPLLGLGGSYHGVWKIPSTTITGAVSLTLTEPGIVTRNGEIQVTGNISYSHPAGSFTVPFSDGKVSIGGIWETISFRMATPEFPNPNSWAVVSLDVAGNGTLRGGENLFHPGGILRESRIWELTRD